VFKKKSVKNLFKIACATAISKIGIVSGVFKEGFLVFAGLLWRFVIIEIGLGTVDNTNVTKLKRIYFVLKNVTGIGYYP